MNLRLIAAGVALVVLGAAVSAAMFRQPESTQQHPSDWIGRQMPPVQLLDPAGNPVALDQALKGKRSVLYVASREVCLDCSKVPMEIRVIRRSLPHLRQFFIGVGADTEFFTKYASDERMTPSTLLDPDNAIGSALGTGRKPLLVLIVDEHSRIVHIDSRSGAAYSPFGTSRVVASLRAVLTDSTSDAASP